MSISKRDRAGLLIGLVLALTALLLVAPTAAAEPKAATCTTDSGEPVGDPGTASQAYVGPTIGEVLRITGTDNLDRIVVSLGDEGRIVVDASFLSEPVSFDALPILFVYGCDGADRITVGDGIFVGLTVWGDAGNDRMVIGDTMSSTLVSGGAGNDRIVVSDSGINAESDWFWWGQIGIVGDDGHDKCHAGDVFNLDPTNYGGGDQYRVDCEKAL